MPLPPMSDTLRDYYSANPLAAFNFLYPTTGYHRAKTDWFRSRYQPLFEQYEAAGPSAPNASFMDFLGGTNLGNDFMNLSPAARGEQRGLMTPRINYNSRWFR